MPDKLRLVVLTAGAPSRHNRFLFRRLLDEDRVEIAAIVVDDGAVQSLRRLRFLRRRWGTAQFAASVVVRLAQLAMRLFVGAFERIWHDRFVPVRESAGYEELAAAGLRIEHVDGVNSERALELLSSLAPDLGLIVGGRIVATRILEIPRLGMLNVHKHDARKYRGGGQIGYAERVAGESAIAVTIHFAVPAVDAGDIVAQRTIPIERFDTDESLQIKADCAGAELYLEAVLAIAAGSAVRSPQAPDEARTDVTTPYLKRLQLWRPIRRSLWRAIRAPGGGPVRRAFIGGFQSARFAACMAALPWLAHRRAALERAGRAPIVILYYHGVGNGAENWMTLPLEMLHRQLDYLRSRFEIISLDEALRRLRAGRNDRSAVVLTFDDGYRTLHDNLLPYLRVHELPATFFVCAVATEQGERLVHDTSKGYHDAPLMSVRQLVAASAIAAIGSHGNRHEDMAQLSGEALREAVVESGNRLERLVGRPVPHFSFPHGAKHNISAEAMAVARERYTCALSAYGGYNIPGQSDGFHLQRFANPTNLHSLVAIANGLHRRQPYYVDQAPEVLG